MIYRACGVQEIRREDKESFRKQFASCRFSRAHTKGFVHNLPLCVEPGAK
jgi:hypothetical protein